MGRKYFRSATALLILFCSNAVAYDVEPPSGRGKINLKCTILINGVQKTAFVFIQQQLAGIRASLELVNDRGEVVESVYPEEYNCNPWGCSRATEEEGYVDSIFFTDSKIKFESKPQDGIHGRKAEGSFFGEINRITGGIVISKNYGRQTYSAATGVCNPYVYIPPKTKF